MLVKVTKQDIEKGVSGDSRWCPISHSLRRAGFYSVQVELDNIAVNGERYPVSTAAQKFIKHFDADRPVKPTTFLIKGQARPRAE